MKIEREWRSVPDYPDYYEVSNDGLVRSIRTGEMLAGWINSYGYRTVSLVVNGKRATKKVHRLVALAFIPTMPGKSDVNHIDGNKLNNYVENLEWVTRGENNRHAMGVLGKKTDSRPVVQTTLDGQVLAIHANMSSAARIVGGTAMMISACCKGTARTAYNYRWKFATSAQAEGLSQESEEFWKHQRLSALCAEREKLERRMEEVETEIAMLA